MKFAAIDAGNTSVAACLWEDGAVSHVSHIDGGREAAEAEAARLVECAGNPDGIAYVSVTPAADAAWERFAAARGLRFVRITAALAVETGLLRLDYAEPATIGADRIADAVGAMAKYRPPLIIMDFGTALTAAAITGDGVWRGGVIAPGLPLMLDYMHERTAQLPAIGMPAAGEVRLPGRSTVEAMRAGAIYGSLGMVKEIASRLAEQTGIADFTRIATGGYARRVLSAEPGRAGFAIDETLTLFGAGLVADAAVKRTKEQNP